MIRFLGFLSILMFVVLLTACGGGGPGPDVKPVDDIVQEGQNALLNGNGDAAKASFSEALGRDSNHPGANFGMAFIELMSVANDLVEFLSAQNDPLFRNVSWYFAAPAMDFPIAQDTFLDLDRVIGGIEDDYNEIEIDDNTFEALRQKVISLLDPMETIGFYLDKTIAATNGNDAWTFTVPEDWNDPPAGFVNIWRGDVIALSAALNALQGGMHFAVAYSPGPLGFTTDEFGALEITGLNPKEGPPVDTNGDNYIDLGEIADHEGFPSGFGVFASDGSGHLGEAVVYWRVAFTRARDAVDSYIAVDAPLTHWAFEELTSDEYAEYKADWLAYGRAYANDLIEAFTNGKTFIVRSQLLEDYPELVDDPGIDFTIRINFAEFFTSLPADMRDFPIRLELTEWDELVLPALATDGFTDNTLLGLFPDGIPQKYYEELI